MCACVKASGVHNTRKFVVQGLSVTAKDHQCQPFVSLKTKVYVSSNKSLINDSELRTSSLGLPGGGMGSGS